MRKKMNFMLAVAFLLLAQLSSGASSSWAASYQELLTQPPFGDPGDTQKMPQEWVEQGIKHPSPAEDIDLYATVSYQLTEFLEAELQRYAQEQGVKLFVREGTDGTSAGALARKEADIACFCGSPKKTDRLPGVRFHTIAVVPVAFFVHPDVPTKNLSLDSTIKIFRGEIDNWSQLGGPDLRIQPVVRSHCKERRGRWKPLENMVEVSPAAIQVGSIEDALSYVEATPGSIGYEILPILQPLKNQGGIKLFEIGYKGDFRLFPRCIDGIGNLLGNSHVSPALGISCRSCN